MDYLTNKEIDGLKCDIKASDVALEAEKYAFEKMLKEKIGPQMIDDLNKEKEFCKKEERLQQKKKKKFTLKYLLGLYK